MSKIKNVKAREILDSRGNPTVEMDVTLDNGIVGRGAPARSERLAKHNQLFRIEEELGNRAVFRGDLEW